MISDDSVDRWEQLEDYLAGRIDPISKQQLEQRMKVDTQLVDDLESVRQAHRLLSDAFAEQQMLATIARIRAETNQTPAESKLIWWRPAIWATAACLLLIGYMSLSAISLPNAGYDIQPLRGIDTTQLPAQQRLAYANFFDGQAYMAEGDYVLAAHHFETVLTATDLRPYFREAAEWHLTVSYLRSRQISRAKHLYRQLQACETCSYEVGWLERRKMEWQLLLSSLIP